MARQNEISSTEKLLNVIRNDSPASINITPDNSGIQNTPEKKIFPSPLSSRGEITVGIDIGYSDIKLIKIKATSEKTFSLLEYATVPLDTRISRASAQFPDFLRKTLQNFVGANGKTALWSTISSAEVEVKSLLVPKVARKHLANSVFWTFKKETPINERLSIFDFEVQDEVSDKGIRKTAVLAYTAPKKNINELKELFAGCGYPLTGITIAPFALQNLFRTNWVAADAEQVVCHLYIGRDWSRIDIFSHGQLVLIRGIKTGVHSMAEELIEAVSEKRKTPSAIAATDDISLTLEEDASPATAPDEPSPPLTMEEACRILYNQNGETTSPAANAPGTSLSQKEIFEMIQPAVERLIRQIERTFDHYVSVSGGSAPQKVYISGKVDTYETLVTYISDQLGRPCTTINPFTPSAANQKGGSRPRSSAERISYTLAMGLALSHNDRTPNFLYTHQDKTLQARTALFEKAALTSFLVGALICGGIFLWQLFDENSKETALSALDAEIAQYTMVTDRNFISQLTEQVKAKKKRGREYSQRYLAMAALNELTLRTPQNIALASTTYMAELPEAAASAPEEPEVRKKKNMIINGMISGDRQMLDSDLAGYMVRLAGSPLFGQPTLVKNSIDTYDGNVVLSFTLSLELH